MDTIISGSSGFIESSVSGSGMDFARSKPTQIVQSGVTITIDPITGKKIGGFTGRGFVPGDPRINRLGRPKNAETLQKAVNRFLTAEFEGTEGEKTTALDELIRDWAFSKNFQKQNGVLERGFGKVKENVHVEVDMKQLSKEQLERIAAGEDIMKVLSNR